MILPSLDVAETLKTSHGVSRLVGAVVGTLDLQVLECHRVERGSRCRVARKDLWPSPTESVGSFRPTDEVCESGSMTGFLSRQLAAFTQPQPKGVL